MLIAIRTIVTIGSRDVGTLSLSGIRAGRDYRRDAPARPQARPTSGRGTSGVQVVPLTVPGAVTSGSEPDVSISVTDGGSYG